MERNFSATEPLTRLCDAETPGCHYAVMMVKCQALITERRTGYNQHTHFTESLLHTDIMADMHLA